MARAARGCATLVCDERGRQRHTRIEIEPAQVAAWLRQEPGLQLVDVRETYEREAGHIEGTRHSS